MRGELSITTKSFQIELRLANQIGRIKFVRLNICLFDELTDSRNIQAVLWF